MAPNKSKVNKSQKTGNSQPSPKSKPVSQGNYGANQSVSDVDFAVDFDDFDEDHVTDETLAHQFNRAVKSAMTNQSKKSDTENLVPLLKLMFASMSQKPSKEFVQETVNNRVAENNRVVQACMLHEYFERDSIEQRQRQTSVRVCGINMDTDETPVDALVKWAMSYDAVIDKNTVKDFVKIGDRSQSDNNAPPNRQGDDGGATRRKETYVFTFDSTQSKAALDKAKFGAIKNRATTKDTVFVYDDLTQFRARLLKFIASLATTSKVFAKNGAIHCTYADPISSKKSKVAVRTPEDLFLLGVDEIPMKDLRIPVHIANLCPTMGE